MILLKEDSFMSLNNTPSGERIHIGLFGRRNAGKSSIINAITGQNLAIVSDIEGTTTDPVIKSMELLPLGPVVVIDTPGLDDVGELGALRIRKAYQMLNKTDIALLIIDSGYGVTDEDLRILKQIQKKNIPYLVVLNKCELTEDLNALTNALAVCQTDSEHIIPVSAEKRIHIQELKDRIASLAPDQDSDRRIVGDLIHPSDFIVLVVPVDKAAPKGRLILPQQQTIRDILDSRAISIVVQDSELKDTLDSLGRKPSLVITDSQVFGRVAKDTPHDIPMTSFSILFARYKGNLKSLVNGAQAIDTLEDGDKVLISEGCTHHRQCGDIGTEKLPNWLKQHTGKNLTYEFTSGTEFPLELDQYKLIIHCGGCMLNEREMKYRMKCAEDAGIPMTNYGTAIAHMHGILERSLEVFSDL